MLSEKMQKALNDQINEEMYSSYLYLSMAAHFEAANWDGFAQWMKVQAKEEYDHAMKFFKHVNDMGGQVTLEAIAKPKNSWDSALQIFEESLKHENHISELIHHLVEVAAAEKDYATGAFLTWFVTEQVEEVATVEKIISDFGKIGDSKGSLYMLDKSLGKRV